ncbi:MAG TPA: glutamine amidotransferase [Candidatus Aquilonibacter sp.]|nr:glutamine amidotransferase [Candidatus Aquilonibacter sp.]
MFEFFFKYPTAIFSKGQFVLLSGWPHWLLYVLMAAAAAALAWLIHRRMAQAAAGMKGWHAAAIWALESLLAVLLLLVVWQPAIVIAELKPQQNIIAVLVDDSRSMSLADNGTTREQQAVKALNSGVLDQLQKKFQTRIYRVDNQLTRVSSLDSLQNATAPATRLGATLKDFADETSGLPIGAVVLMSDGADNTGGIDASTIAALRSREIPVDTVGFGPEQVPNDVEINDVTVAPRIMQNSRLSAAVTFHQNGFSGRKATLAVHDGDKLLASREITLASDGTVQTEALPFNAGAAGVKSLRFSIDPLPGETNTENNAVTRELDVTQGKRKILYVEGEPRWEYKFIRRAEDDDPNVQLVSMLRTTENKIYRQGITSPDELADGFPSTADVLFQYQAIIIGSIEAGYFTPAQQELMREFVDRRGGGMLFLGGRSSLAAGIWQGSAVADLLPVVLPTSKDTFRRDPAIPILTQAGADSMVTRLDDDPQKNAERWKKLPYMMDYQDAGTTKPGAAVLLQMRADGRTLPLLITENYGRGRTAVMATGGSWRWQMLMPLGDTSYFTFWQQLLRWLIQDTPGQVVASVPNPMLYDDGHIQISADVRDKTYTPATDAQVQAQIMGPNGFTATVDMQPAPNSPGIFQADFTADQPGSYIANVTAQRAGQELGSDSVPFERLDGVAENFHTGQNRALLEELASQTGGKYWTPSDLAKLPAEIPYSAAGITMRDTKELWDMPIIFFLVILLRFSEWFLRRKWGIV